MSLLVLILELKVFCWLLWGEELMFVVGVGCGGVLFLVWVVDGEVLGDGWWIWFWWWICWN